MIRLQLPISDSPLRVLCLGAHADDIEIGCGGTIIRLIEELPAIDMRWVIFSGNGEREVEARNSARNFLRGCNTAEVEILEFRDGYFPSQSAPIKDRFEALKQAFSPSLIFTHWLGDAHQDHRLVAELSHNTFRNHLILSYEIPKYDGDLGNPNLFFSLGREHVERKSHLIVDNFRSQTSRAWFTRDTFFALARLRGIACNAPDGVAEGFYSSKLAI